MNKAFLQFIIVAAVLGNAPKSNAQPIVFFPGHTLFQPYTSELRSTFNSIEIFNASKAPPQYPWEADYNKRVMVETKLSVDLPLLGMPQGRFKWLISLPLSITTVNDFFEKDSAPILNSDYWFGAKIEILYKLNWTWPRNIGLRILPIFHESTHIGDEFALAIVKNKKFYRVNLSYEAWEITVSLNEAIINSGNNLNFRAGMSANWKNKSYYKLPPKREIGSDAPPIHLSRRDGIEFFFQVNSQWTKGFPAIGGWTFRANMELRNRILLNYFSTKNEEYVWTLSSTLGWYRYTANQLLGNLGFYLRVLYGQNPYGQLREQKDYFSIALGVTLGS